MTDADTEARPPRPTAKQPAARRPPWPPVVETTLADWRTRWPQAFTKPVPLAVGFSGHIKAALRADGTGYDRKTLGMAIQQWTLQGAYLRAVARGEMRRNLDGSEAGMPDEATRQSAQKLLDERATRRAERERQRLLAKSPDENNETTQV